MAPESTIDRSENHESKCTFMRPSVWRWSSTARASPHSHRASRESMASGISAAQSMTYCPW